MKNNLRSIIRKEINLIFEAMDGGVLDDAMTNIEDQITANIKNLDDIKKATDQDVENKENIVKGQKQLKSQLPAQNPDRQGLEKEIPAKEKEIVTQKKQGKDIEKAKTDFQKTQDELAKKQAELAQAKPDGEKGTPVLKSLESPI